jgi:putative chitinase
MRFSEFDPQYLEEGPHWDRFKKTAQGAALGAGIVGAAALGLGDKPTKQDLKGPAVTYTQQDVQKDKDTQQSLDPNTDIKPSTQADKKVDNRHTSQYANRTEQAKLVKSLQSAGVKGVELAAFLAQAAHETLGFTRYVESGSKDYFAQYDGKLGNDKPGDGYRYRGRSYLHITGKENYAKIGKAIGVDLVKHPELLEKPEIGFKASLWYWKNKVKSHNPDFGDVISITQLVNGSATGLGDRSKNFDSYIQKMGL